MLMLVDVGNTNLVIAVAADGSPGPVRRAPTPAGGHPADVERVLEGLLAEGGRSLGEADRIAAASVVPAVGDALAVVARRRGIPLLLADAATVPIRNRAEAPAEVGADRLVNAFAAARIHGAPAVVVDLGTATTFDCVAPDGGFEGGAIAPGLELGLAALAERTARLPRVDARSGPPTTTIGQTTVDAIRSGTVLGHALLVEALAGRMRGELAAAHGLGVAAVRTILTGGLAAAPWAAAIGGIDVVDPHLTLRGLALLGDGLAAGVRR